MGYSLFCRLNLLNRIEVIGNRGHILFYKGRVSGVFHFVHSNLREKLVNLQELLPGAMVSKAKNQMRKTKI